MHNPNKVANPTTSIMNRWESERGFVHFHNDKSEIVIDISKKAIFCQTDVSGCVFSGDRRDLIEQCVRFRSMY